MAVSAETSVAAQIPPVLMPGDRFGGSAVRICVEAGPRLRSGCTLLICIDKFLRDSDRICIEPDFSACPCRKFKYL